MSQQEFSPEQVEQIRRASRMWKEKITDVMTQKQAVATKIDENVVSTMNRLLVLIK